jgi:hypothetical protein
MKIFRNRSNSLSDIPETASDKKRKNKLGVATVVSGLGTTAAGIAAHNKISRAIGQGHIDKKLMNRVGKVSSKTLEKSREVQNTLLNNKISNRALKIGTIGVAGSLLAGKLVASRKVQHKSINDDEPKYCISKQNK